MRRMSRYDLTDSEWRVIEPQGQPQGPDLLQPAPLQGAELGRALLQQSQAVPPHRDPIQAGRELSRRSQTRRNPHLATR
jgi:transposase